MIFVHGMEGQTDLMSDLQITLNVPEELAKQAQA
jgi:hypothetical protein